MWGCSGGRLRRGRRWTRTRVVLVEVVEEVVVAVVEAVGEFVDVEVEEEEVEVEVEEAEVTYGLATCDTHAAH